MMRDRRPRAGAWRVVSAVAARGLLLGAAHAARRLHRRPGLREAQPSRSRPPTRSSTAGRWREPQDETLPRRPGGSASAIPRLSALEAQVDISNQNRGGGGGAAPPGPRAGPGRPRQLLPDVTVGRGADPRPRRRPTLERTAASNAGRTDHDPPAAASTSRGSWTSGAGSAARVESSRASAQASAADLEAARLSVQAELAQDYFQLRALDAEKQLLDATVAAYERVAPADAEPLRERRGVTGRRAAGRDPAQDDPGAGDRRGRAARAARARHRGAPRAARLDLQRCRRRRWPATPPDIPVGLPAELLERRPDVAAAERRVAAANAQIGVAVAAYYPTVTLSAGGGLESGSVAQWLTWPSRFWSVGPGISQTVFDGGLRGAQTDAGPRGLRRHRGGATARPS